jgi:putative peptidoglycan lipid II flippase
MLLTSLGNFLSRLSGLLRDLAFAASFGTGPIASAFLWAFMLPNLFRNILGEGALTASFIPLFSEVESQEGESAARHFASMACTLLALSSGALTVLMALIMLTAGFFLPADHQIQVQMAALMMVFMPFVCLSAFVAGLLNIRKAYGLAAVSSSLLNLLVAAACLIGPVLNPDKEIHIWLLPAAVILSGTLQLWLLLRALQKNGMVLDWSPQFDREKLKHLWVLFVPALIGSSCTQLSLFIDRNIAVWLSPHALPAINYSERLVYLPVGIFGVALGVACLPIMSKAVADNKPSEVREALDFGLRQSLFLSLPFACLFFVWGEDIVRLIFQRGAFDQQSVLDTCLALKYFVIGIPVFTAVKVVLQLFYSHKDTRTPVKISLSCLVINLFACLSLLIFAPSLKWGSLTLATVISSSFNLLLLLIYASRRHQHQPSLSCLFALLRITACCLVATFTAKYAVDSLVATWQQIGSSFLRLACRLSFICFVAGGLYFVLLRLCGGREASQLISTLRRRKAK